jgi:hypothetical protein
MTRWLQVLAFLAAVAGIAAACVVMVAGGRWRGATEGTIQQMRTAASATAEPYDPAQIDGLPGPVASYFRSALRPGQPMIRSARLRQVGEFLAAEGDDGWRPFEATEFFTADPPAFVWDARITMMPLFDVRVRDQYREGRGEMEARLAAVVPVMRAESTPELASGALLRYLAEAVWLPTALLPASGVRWSAIDDRRALGTLSDSGVEVSLEFRFDAEGDIVGVYAPERYREQDGRYVPTPWVGSFSDHEVRAGMRVPLTGQVSWVMPEGERPDWRGRIQRIG